MKIFASTIALLATAVTAQEVCEVATQGEVCVNGGCVDGGCSGVSFFLVSGECSPLFSVCDDGDDSTESSCNASKCTHLVTGDDPVCFTDCVPSCDGKECGEDDCGGFCGACGVGAGCSNFACVTGGQDGGCEAPLNLGNTDTIQVIDTDDRVTVITEGDTTQSLHRETPSCNTLTASPELIYTFEVPAGRTYGYDMQLSGFDTVVQLMKVSAGANLCCMPAY
jgi:hypothetical protein